MYVSKRLFTILTQKINVKINQELYHVKLNVWTSTYNNNGDIAIDGIDDTDFDWFCYSKNSRITCWPKRNGEQPLTADGKWRAEGRQEIRPGRFFLIFSDLLNVEDDYGCRCTTDTTPIVARAAEIFADTIKGINAPLNYQLSTNISAIYGMEGHPGGGYLLNSCMRPRSGHSCNGYSGFYDTIPDLKIVYEIQNGMLMYRALLWENLNVYHRKGKKRRQTISFLDRIYAHESTMHRLYEIAIVNGWAWREFGDNRIVAPDRESKLVLYTNPLPKEALAYLDEEGAPYVDTLRYLIRYRNHHILSSSDDDGDPPMGICVSCIQNCSGETLAIYPQCSLCESTIRGRYRTIAGLVVCDACVKARITNCASCMAPIIKDHYETIYCADDHRHYCTSCAEDRALKKCQRCGEWHYRDNVVSVITRSDGRKNYYCHECLVGDAMIQQCRHCGEFYRVELEKRITIDGSTIATCPGCNPRFTSCAVCGTKHSYVIPDFIPTSSYVCDECMHNPKIAEVPYQYDMSLERWVNRTLPTNDTSVRVPVADAVQLELTYTPILITI